MKVTRGKVKSMKQEELKEMRRARATRTDLNYMNKNWTGGPKSSDTGIRRSAPKGKGKR